MKKSKFDRVDSPPPIRLTDRDIDLIQAIQDYGGFLSFRHLHYLFFEGRDRRTMERRLSILFHNQYLEWPSLEQRRTKPIPEAIYWLGWRGILLIAALQGVDITEPVSDSLNQMKLLEKELRSQGIYWLSEPHWIQTPHDIKVIDLRLAFERGLGALPNLALVDWVNEHSFRVDHDRVSIDNGKGKRGVIPDLYLMLVDEGRKSSGDPEHKAHLLFEIDMATRDNPRFEREKLQAYAAYIGSPAFKERFYSEVGSWLVVTTGKKRMRNLIRQTIKLPAEKRRHFFFSTFHQVDHSNPLTDPIWWRPGAKEPVSLIPKVGLKRSQAELVYRAAA